MMRRERVRNENLVRDPRTTALLSTDKDAIMAYERKKRERQVQEDRLNTLEREVAALKEQVAQLRKNGNAT
jgi:uncharacterized protein YceH (UPF0502 family)